MVMLRMKNSNVCSMKIVISCFLALNLDVCFVNAALCDAGSGLGNLRTSGVCTTAVYNNQCEDAANSIGLTYTTTGTSGYARWGCVIKGSNLLRLSYGGALDSVNCGYDGYNCICRDECNPCNVGWISLGGADVLCTKCPAGKYNEFTGATNCIPCGYGNYSATDASSSCTSCAVGKYTTDGSNTECIQCPVGKISVFGGTNCVELDSGNENPLINVLNSSLTTLRASVTSTHVALTSNISSLKGEHSALTSEVTALENTVELEQGLVATLNNTFKFKIAALEHALALQKSNNAALNDTFKLKVVALEHALALQKSNGVALNDTLKLQQEKSIKLNDTLALLYVQYETLKLSMQTLANQYAAINAECKGTTTTTGTGGGRRLNSLCGGNAVAIDSSGTPNVAVTTTTAPTLPRGSSTDQIYYIIFFSLGTCCGCLFSIFYVKKKCDSRKKVKPTLQSVAPGQPAVEAKP